MPGINVAAVLHHLGACPRESGGVVMSHAIRKRARLEVLLIPSRYFYLRSKITDAIVGMQDLAQKAVGQSQKAHELLRGSRGGGLVAQLQALLRDVAVLDELTALVAESEAGNMEEGPGTSMVYQQRLVDESMELLREAASGLQMVVSKRHRYSENVP